jgi:hypothetical protein
MKHSAVSSIKASLPNVKKNKFNLSHDNNTTYDWGSVQPLMSKMMLPDSSININMEQLTRLAPMVVPTFGRVKMKNIAHFIPMQEIFPNWDAMMSQTKVTRSTSNNGATVNSYVPKNVPFIANNALAAFCLAGAKVNVYWSGLVANGEDSRWFCTNNRSPDYDSPTPNASMTTACRALLYQVFDIKDTATPTTATLTDWNYTGYDYWVRRLVRRRNGSSVFNTSANGGGNILRLPTISTMTPQPLENANGIGFTHSADNENLRAGVGGANVNLGPVTFDGADIIWEYSGPTGAGITAAERALTNDSSPVAGLANNSFDGRKIRFVFKLSSFGKRLRKILIGLGYDVNLANDDNVSILPLVAFYKAWWDTYAPERYKNFYETAAWKLINASMVNAQCCDLITIMNGTTGVNMRSFFVQFMVDLGTCFATERMDAISAATDNVFGASNTTQDTFGNTELQNVLNQMLQYNILNEYASPNASGDWGADGSHDVNLVANAGSNYEPAKQNNVALNIKIDSVSAQFTQPQIDALKKAYIILNKSSVAGMKVAEILRALGFGDYVEECRGKFINAQDSGIKISDVVATAATADAKLGQYGGRGIGVGNFQFSFKTNRHGYMIILSAIVPEAGYINAPVHENEAISFETMYNPEFDGLAYEAVQKKNLVGSPLVNDKTYADTFGFLPTYSQWKFMTNKANGDFSLNSMKTSLTPYTLDKYIPVGDANVYGSHVIDSGTNEGTTEIDCAPSFKYSDLPNAGEDWRYVNKFPWNGNYNRIFADVDDGYEWSVFSKNNNQFLYNSFEYDNFLVHNVFDIAYWAPMKSIEESYGTFDEEHGAPNTSISKS